MNQKELGPEQPSLRRYVKISVIAHGLLFLALTVQSTFFSEAPLPLEKAIRVDIVGLPDKIQEESPAPIAEQPAPEVEQPQKEEAPQPEPPKPEVPKPVAKVEAPAPKLPPLKTRDKDLDAINLDKAKTKQQQALARLKQMEALEEIQKQVERDSKKKAVQAASQVKYKGNVLNAGSELTGVNKLQAEGYIDDITKHILANWTAPAYYRNRNLKTRVMVRLDESGYVLGKEIIRSSGNPAFDELVLAAIQKSSPVPAPPAKFSKIASVEGFLISFSPDSI